MPIASSTLTHHGERVRMANSELRGSSHFIAAF
jgi:hypothetical protein